MRKSRKTIPASELPASRRATDGFEYPTGMVWCPMKMSGMGIMRCARLQRELGCGTLREHRALKATKPEYVTLFWPWLQRKGECPERATEQEFRELLLAVTSLKLVEHSGKNPRAYRCSGCGGRKAFSARQCRRCWLVSVQSNGSSP